MCIYIYIYILLAKKCGSTRKYTTRIGTNAEFQFRMRHRRLGMDATESGCDSIERKN